MNRNDSVCLVQARFVGILQMVSGNEFRNMVKLHGKEPQSFLVGTHISSPADKVQELAVMPSVKTGSPQVLLGGSGVQGTRVEVSPDISRA